MANLFDTYSRQARLQPALFALFPLLVTIAVWVPTLYNLAAGFVGLAVTCGTTVFLAHVSRMLGRRAEADLYSLWGGKPTTRWLCHSNEHLDSQTKTRYHSFLEKSIDGWNSPSPRDESDNLKSAEIAYESAVRWLREKTRDRERFPLIFKENVSYGFRRNLYGLKLLALAIGFICLAGNGSALWYVIASSAPSGALQGVGSLVFNVVVLLCWVAIVRASWVKDAADGYARALLAACDQLDEDTE